MTAQLLFVKKGKIMLVLTRKKNEQIILSDGITITILSCKDGSVKIGFEAPDDIRILRKEVSDKLKEKITKSQRE